MLATLKNFAHALSGSSIMQLATLVSALIVSNMFGPLGLSKFGIVQTTITTIASVLPFGLGYTAINFMNKGQDDGLGLSVASFVYQLCLITSLASALILALFSEFFSQQFFLDNNLSIYITFAAIGLPFATITVIQYAILNGLQAYADMAKSSYISAFVTIIIVLVCAWSFGLKGTIIGFLLTIFIRAIILQYLLDKYLNVKLSLPSIKVWRRIRSFAIPVGLAGLTMGPSTWYSNSLLIKYEGLEVQGIMMAALTIRMAISFIPQQLSTVLLPKYLQSNDEFIYHELLRIFRYVALLGVTSLFLCLFVFTFRNYLITLFGNNFHADTKIMALLLISVTLDAAATPFAHVHAKYERMWRFALISSLPRDLFFLVICLNLIPIYGALGMAIAFSISSLICTVLVSASALTVILKLGKKNERLQ